MRRLKRFALTAASIAFAALPLGRAAGDPSAPFQSQGPVFRFKRLLIADTAQKVAALRPPPGASERVIVEDIPMLATDEFADLVEPLNDRPITQEFIDQITKDVRDYVRKHGQLMVDITVPPQNVSNGEFRLVVVIGAPNLYRLIVADSEEHAAVLKVPSNATQIVIQDVPLLATQEFAVRMAPYFNQPITQDSVTRLQKDITAYAKERGQVVARIAIPTQSIAGGEFRVGVLLGTYPLKQLAIADSAASADAMKVKPGGGPVVAKGVPALATPEFTKFIAPHFGRPITNEEVEKLRTDVLAYLRSHDRPVADVTIPLENLPAGEIRLAVTIGRYGDLMIKGNRWFSDKLLMSKLGIKPGDEVRTSTLEEAVNWANNSNPFRQIHVLVDTRTMQPGTANLDVSVQERIPLRVVAAYDDAGNAVIGNNHYTTLVQLGNLWGLDHQLSYQYTTTDRHHLYQAQAGEYRIPLPWRDSVAVSFAQAVFEPEYQQGLIKLKGKNIIADLKDLAPRTFGSWSADFSLGIDFKQTNNNLAFGGFQISKSDTDVFQAIGGVTVKHADRLGRWDAGGNISWSPGGINQKDTDLAFSRSRFSAVSRYVYASLFLQRTIELPFGLESFSRAQVQLSTADLLGSEQLVIGGHLTVRGYNEAIYAGDEGFVVSEELRSPVWRQHVPFTPKTWQPIGFRTLLFWDYGRVQYTHPLATDFPLYPLMSVGWGVRAALASNFSLSADFGRQILKTHPAQPNNWRGHVQASLAY